MHDPLARCLLVSLLLLGLPALAPAAPLETLEQVEECIKSNRPGSSAVQTYSLVSVDRIGSKKTSEGKILWKRSEDGLSKVVVRVTGPPDVRGTAALLIQRKEGDPDIFSYLPELQRVRRITQRAITGSFMGTDFSYEDLERIQGLSEDAERSLAPPQEVEGRPAYVIEGRPGRGSDSEYTRVVTFVDQETCVPLRVEAFEAKDRLAKVFTLPHDQVRQVSGRPIPHAIAVVDERDGTRTDLKIDEVELDVDISDREFSSAALERRR
jgi:outer membrane lipoprotein-sorting protein